MNPQRKAIERLKQKIEQKRIDRITKQSIHPTHKLKKVLGKKGDSISSHFPETKEKVRKLIFKNMPGDCIGKKSIQAKTIASALSDHLTGDSQKDVEERYNLGNGTVNALLKRIFPDRAKMQEQLRNITAHNALLANQKFEEKANDLTAIQAAISSGIFIQRHIELEKAVQTDYRDTIDVNLITNLESVLSKAKQIHPKIIELTEGNDE